jgi:hypothetical protein
MKPKIEISIYLTWSKIVALIVLVLAFIIDMKHGGAAFELALPCACGLILGKQWFDRGKEKYIKDEDAKRE